MLFKSSPGVGEDMVVLREQENQLDDNQDVSSTCEELLNEIPQPEKTTTLQCHTMDSGVAWFVMCGAFLNTATTIVFLRSISMFFVAYVDKFQVSAAETTLAFGLSALAAAMSSILQATFFLQRYSERCLSLIGSTLNVLATIGLAFSPNILIFNLCVVAIGFSRGFVLVPAISILGKYFKKRLSLAVSIVNTGYSVATIFGPIVTQYLMDTYDLEGGVLLLAGLNMHLFIGSMMLRPASFPQAAEVKDFKPVQNEYNIPQSPDSCSQCTQTNIKKEKQKQVIVRWCSSNYITSSLTNVAKINRQRFKCKSCCLIYRNPLVMILVLASGLGVHGPTYYGYTPLLGEENGLLSSRVPFLLTIAGVCDLVGKLTLGSLADLPSVRGIHVAVVTQIFFGVTLQFVSCFQSFELMVFLQVVGGVCVQSLLNLLPSITADILDCSYIPHVVSGYFFMNGLILTVNHILVGVFKDVTGSFYPAYQYIGSMYILSACLLLLEHIVSKHYKDQNTSN